MPQMSPKEQRRYLSSLITDISRQHGEQVAHAARTHAVDLSVEQAILLLELTLVGVPGTERASTQDLHDLGYESADSVLSMSRLIDAKAHQKTIPTIVSLGLFQDRAQALLRVAPPGVRLLSVSDDRSWRRAMRALPEEALAEHIDASASRFDLWMAVVSAQDEYMAKRIAEFREAGCAHQAWIVSGHTLEALEGQVPSASKGRALTRLEIHRAVRSLDRGEGGGEVHEQDQDGE